MQPRRARSACAIGGLALFLAIAFHAPALAAQAAAGPAAARFAGPTTIEALSIEGVSEFEINARGAVELRRDDTGIFTELLRYRRDIGRVDAEGGVRIERGGDRFFGSRLRYDLEQDTGTFDEPRFILSRAQTIRGSAERLDILGRHRFRLVGGSFTSCAPGREDWRFEAQEIELDYLAEEGRLRDGRLKFHDTTLLAIPRGSFPLERRRKSGFLTPHYSQNTRRGLELSLPYYWNIAPEQDLLLTPVYMTKRGPELKAQYRYLDRAYSGDLRWEVVPEDRVLGLRRTALALRHEHRFGPEWIGRFDFNRVSDDRYFVDLGSQVSQIVTGNLLREAFTQYNGAIGDTSFTLQARVQGFQTLQDPLSPVVSPYRRVPQLNAAFLRQAFDGRLELEAPVEYARFEHEAQVGATRMVLNPRLALPLTSPGRFVVPRLGLHHADYDLRRTAPGQRSRLGVTVPWASVDAGLIFERRATWFGASATQTLEPRLYYVRAAHRAQDAVPLFDTALADFNQAQLFSENRFAGSDRFGDANHLTLAVTSRLLGAGGDELLRGTIGQRHYFSAERVGLTPASPLRDRGQSDLLASLRGSLGAAWDLEGSVQYNTQQARLERFSASARYAPEVAKMMRASYRFNREALRQIDLVAQWPLAAGWHGVARYNYSLFERRLLEGIAGVEYNAGCWTFRAAFQRLQAATQTTSTSLLFQLEFHGFGGIQSGDVTDFLRRQVPGYAATGVGTGSFLPPGMQQRLPFEQTD